jgi:P4 family phage/plasmid primase-like protien
MANVPINACDDIEHVQSAMTRFGNFIRDTRTNEFNHTHVLLGSPFGKINVSNARLKEFWGLYTECANFSNPIYLAEKPLTELPILVDIDLKTRLCSVADQTKHIYTESQVRKVVRAYQNAIKNDVFQTIRPDALTCVLLEKDPYVIELNGIKYLKNGFHLHFPKAFINVNVQEAYLIPIVKSRLEGLFDNLYEMSDQSSHYDFIDSGSIKVHWLMYGSKKPNNAPYIATKCFLDNAVECSFETALGDYVLPRLVGEPKRIGCKGKVTSLLARILSTRLHGREDLYYYKAKPSVDTPIIYDYAKVRETREIYAQKTVSEILKDVELLMPLINDKRADDRSDWLAIGFCLWNITSGDDEGLSIWLEFSDRSEKFNEAECICLWNGMRGNNYTLGTLKYYAKSDSPVEYEALCRSYGAKLINLAVEGGHNDMAKILYNEYGNEFVYSTSNSAWYRFNNHIWEKSKNTQCFDLSERISDDNGVIIRQLNTHIAEAKNLKRKFDDTCIKKLSSDDRDELDRINAKIKTIDKLIKSCKATHFKCSVMKECCEVFRNNSFSARLNTDPYLVAFNNGVYDFKNDCFRAGRPEDYLAVCTGIDYKNYGSIDHPEVMEVSAFFRKVLTDDQVREYFFDQVCQVFVGGNDDKVILMWTGTGDNGKSITQRLFEKMLGPLAAKISTSLVTGKKQKIGQAAPEMARTGNGCRWVVMDEPNQDEQLTTGTLKSITGNDSIWARDLYQGGSETKEIIPLFKIHMLCNKLPGIRNPDEAFWERIRVIPFESKFVVESKCPENYEDQIAQKLFPKDKQFASKLEAMAQPLAWFLIARWRVFNKSERVEPEKVKIATNEYKEENENDVYQDFVDDYIVQNLASTAYINSDDLYDRFKDWFRMENPRQTVPFKKPCVNAFSKIFKSKPLNKRWPFYSWIEPITDCRRMIMR